MEKQNYGDISVDCLLLLHVDFTPTLHAFSFYLLTYVSKVDVTRNNCRVIQTFILILLILPA